MWEHKCQSAGLVVKQTYPASSLVQSVLMSDGVHMRIQQVIVQRIQPQWASGCVMMFLPCAHTKPEENKHPRVKKKGHLHQDGNEKVQVEAWQGSGTCDNKDQSQNCQGNTSNSKKLCCLWPNNKMAMEHGVTRPHVLPPARSIRAPVLT